MRGCTRDTRLRIEKRRLRIIQTSGVHSLFLLSGARAPLKDKRSGMPRNYAERHDEIASYFHTKWNTQLPNAR